MSKRDPERPSHSARTIADKAARRAREAEALRQNLQKRKQQQRGQQAGTDSSGVKPVATDGEARLETVRPKPYNEGR